MTHCLLVRWISDEKNKNKKNTPDRVLKCRRADACNISGSNSRCPREKSLGVKLESFTLNQPVCVVLLLFY